MDGSQTYSSLRPSCSRRLAANGFGIGVIIWDAASSRELALLGRNLGLHAPRFSPDGRRILLFDADQQETPLVLDFDPDGARLLAGDKVIDVARLASCSTVPIAILFG